jgi:hemolysin III
MGADENFNTATHVFGAVAAAVAAGDLLAAAAGTGDVASIAGAMVLSAACLALFVSSFSFHGSRGRWRETLERVDHAAIHVLVAATYTPFALMAPWHWTSVIPLALLWGVAALVSRWTFQTGQVPPVQVYLLTGWSAVACALPVAATGPAGVLDGLLAGAVVYSAGVFFFLNPWGWRWAHGWWHLFVVAGALLHLECVKQLALS